MERGAGQGCVRVVRERDQPTPARVPRQSDAARATIVLRRRVDITGMQRGSGGIAAVHAQRGGEMGTGRTAPIGTASTPPLQCGGGPHDPSV